MRLYVRQREHFFFYIIAFSPLAVDVESKIVIYVAYAADDNSADER